MNLFNVVGSKSMAEIVVVLFETARELQINFCKDSTKIKVYFCFCNYE